MSVDKKITITFTNSAGDYTNDFPENQPLKAAKVKAITEIGLDASAADQFAVYLRDEELNESKSLSELGLKDGIVLMIERRKIEKVKA